MKSADLPTDTRVLYQPALDGIRLVAFLLVFLHHSPLFASSTILSHLFQYGWVGVELFFLISSLLFMNLLEAEYRKNGRISASRFYIRRILRIYPLMVAFAVGMVLYFRTFQDAALMRLAGIVTMTDNIVTAAQGYNATTPFTAHLWTLSFEFQVYSVIPLVFMAWKRMGDRRFILALLCFYACCFAARLLVTWLGAPHPVVWVLPFLHPEAILIGLVLGTGVLSRVPALVWPVLLVLASWAFISTPVPWTGLYPAALSYPFAALACLSMVETVRRFTAVRTLFSTRAFVFLGTISFGLYVFHPFGLYLGGSVSGMTGWISNVQTDATSYWLHTGTGLAITLLLSVVSYYVLEAPFLRLKDRFATVHGRLVGAVT